MNKKLILILVLALAMANATDVVFNLASTSYVKGSDVWTVNVPCAGGSGNYQYSCDLPTGWSLSNNQFRIPSSCSTNYNYEYITRCRIQDLVSKTILERALCFKATTSGYVITDKDYFYGLTSYSSGSIGTISGADVLSRLTSLTGSISTSLNSGLSTLSALSGLAGNLGVSNYFSGLPAWSDCDGLITNGNIVQILALIQKVVSSTTMKCDAKVAYLNDLLGRINAALQIKKESIAQLQVLIDGIATQIQKLLVQINDLKTQQSNLDLAGLKAQLDALMLKLQDAYNQYNTCTSSCNDYNTELASLQQEQSDLISKINAIKCSIDDLTAKLNQYDANIAALEKQLADLKAQRAQIAANISDLTAQFNSKNDRLTWVKNRIAWLVAKLNDINSNCATLKQNYQALEVSLKALQDKYNQYKAQSDQIDQTIISIQAKISQQNSLSASYVSKQKAIQQTIDNLNGAIKEILQSIRYVQYSCHDCPNVVINNTDTEPCFNIGRNDWFNYIKNCYGSSISTSISVNVTVQIKVVTVYSSVFQNNYGSCFSDQVKNRGSQWNTTAPSYGFDGDFSCSSGFDSVSSNKGTIKGIGSNYVDVACNDGSQVRLKLGSCSRFEGQGNDFVPKVGHNIVWKGAKNSDSTFNLHSCSCY